MKIIAQNYIETERKRELRTLISEIVTDYELEVEEVFSWYEEDNTGDIQIDCSTWALGALESAIEDIKGELLIDEENLEYTYEDLNTLNDLLSIMIEINEKGGTAIYLSE